MIGIVIGFAVGILPGLGGATTLALMLPFTFHMKPVEAFAFLLGMLSVTTTTGDITSILFGVPGEAAAAATVLDGHPMAKKGEAGRALGAALMSSLVGALVGAVALAAVDPDRPAARALLRLAGVLHAGPARHRVRRVALSGGTCAEGLLAGGLGLMLAMVGLDPQSGIAALHLRPRSYLWDGIDLVPVHGRPLRHCRDHRPRGASGRASPSSGVGKIGGVLAGRARTRSSTAG